MKINNQIFRQYDIRGVVEKDMPHDVVVQLGRAFGTYMEQHGAKSVALGRDCRLSSPQIHDSFIEGLKATGRIIYDCGQVPTPLLYFAVHNLKTDAGAMITGSHNPPEYNGIKMQIGPNSLFGDKILEIGKIIEKGEMLSNKEKESSIKEVDIVTPYCDYVVSIIKLNRKDMKVVIDAGNGVAGVVGAKIMRMMGLNPTELYCEPDGRFPNHHPDPTVVANMQDLISKIKAQKADAGIAYDGDGDRIGVIDESGNIIWGDKLMILFSRAILQEQPGATIIGEVKCSQTLYDDIEKHGGKGIMWRTGHSLIKAKMKEEHAALAGEMSGHIFFSHRYLGYDDAIYSSMRLLEILSKTSSPLSKLLSDVPQTFATPEIRVDCDDEIKFEIVDKVVAYFKDKQKVIDVDGARIIYPDGWGLVRASNTQPALVLRFEAQSSKRLEEIRADVENIVKKFSQK